MFLAIALLIIAGWSTLGVLAYVSQIGKPRKPITPGDAVFVVIVIGIMVVISILAAMKLGI